MATAKQEKEAVVVMGEDGEGRVAQQEETRSAPHAVGYSTTTAYGSDMQSAYPVHVAPGGSLQEASEVDVPTATATTLQHPHAYVGVVVDCPDDHSRPLLPPPPSYASYSAAESHIGKIHESHGDVSLGVGDDLAGAESAARRSARRDNAAFEERRSTTEALARDRVEQEARAIDIARVQARRRDAEGLAMRPHPGNRLEPEQPSSNAGLYGEKAFAYGGGGGGGGGGGKAQENSAARRKEGKEADLAAAKGEEEGADAAYAKGGYQCTEYKPTEYDCTEYKSVYDSSK